MCSWLLGFISCDPGRRFVVANLLFCLGDCFCIKAGVRGFVLLL